MKEFGPDLIGGQRPRTPQKSEDGAFQVGQGGFFQRSLVRIVLKPSSAMKTILLPASILLTSLAASPAFALQDEAPEISRSPETATLPDTGVRLPMAIGRARPIPIIQAKIAGQGPFNLYLDLGASVCTLDQAFADRLGLEDVGTLEIGAPGSDHRLEARRRPMPLLEIGDARFEDFEVVSFDRSSFTGSDEIVGSVGPPLFAELLLTLDYPNSEIWIRRGALPEPDGETVIGYDASWRLPLLEIELAGNKITSAVDSGSPSFLVLPGNLPETLRFQQEPQVVGRARTVNGEFEVKAATVDGDLRVGGHSIPEPDVILLEAFPFAVLGHGFLRDFSITLDQLNHRLRFTRGADHAGRLNALAGDWRVEVTMNSGSAPATQFAGEATVHAVHDGKFLQEDIRLNAGGRELEATTFLGWNPDRNRYELTQLDVFNPGGGVVWMTGTWDEEQQRIRFEPALADSPPMRWDYLFDGQAGFTRQLHLWRGEEWQLQSEYRYLPQDSSENK